MKKRLLSMLMAVLMIVSLVPAVALADADTCTHKNTTEITIEKNAETKTPGITAKICDDCGVVVDGVNGVKVTPFAKPKDQCKPVCTNPVTKELKVATCNNEGLTVVYCGTCGKAIKVVIKEALEHVYKFSVSAAPTCEDDGWGYAICTLCGHAQFVSDSDAVEALISKSAYTTNDVFDKDAYNKAVEDAEALYAALGHVKASDVTVVAKDIVDEEDGETVLAKAAVTPTHAATIKGYAVAYKDGKIVSASVEGAKVPDCSGYTGDKVCPTCGDTDTVKTVDGYEGTVLPELNKAHKEAMTTLKEGEKPYYDAENEEYVDGMTDKVYCSECNKIFGGETITYEDFYGKLPVDPEIGTVKVVENETEINVNGTVVTAKPAKPATCESKGYTGDTVKYVQLDTDANGKAVCAWIFNERGKDIPELGHHFVAKESVAATCEKGGHTYKGVYVCDRITDEKTGATCGYEKHDVIFTDKDTPALGHDYTVEKVIVEPTCLNKGISVLACSHCGELEKVNGIVKAYYTAKVNHVAADELANVVAATCTEAGYSGDQVCKWCGETLKKGEEVPALGHKTEVKDAKAATCTEAGYTGDEVCTVCGETVKKGTEIPALGHKFENGVCTVCGAADPNYVVPNPFKDVAKTSPYYDAIIWAAKEEITTGKTADTFGIDEGCTRAQIVTFLYRAAGSPEVKADTVNPFTDVSKDSVYYNAILWAVENGITKGTTDTTFDPNAVCTRGQIVTFLFRASGDEKVATGTNFADVASGSYCADAVAWAVANKVANGFADGTFRPEATCTRGQAVTFIFRALAK